MTLLEAKARFDQLIASAAGVDDPRVRTAFSSVPRERFVGPGPWRILAAEGYVGSHGADPALLYDDIVIALLPQKRINNGQPTLHARCLSAARVQPGESVLHVGCGTGYYSALLCELVTPTGTVRAWDVEPDLVAAAFGNLAERPHVNVELRDATASPVPRSDVIYVCAGCTHPIRAWAEALTEGGRLLFPLTPGWGAGAMLMVTRLADHFEARFLCRCAFIPSVGGSVTSEELAIRKAFSDPSFERVSSLHFGPPPLSPEVWLSGTDWWLSTDTLSVH